MNSLMEKAARAEIVARLARLTPQSKRTWGKMDVSQVLPHLADGLRMSLGDIAVKTPPHPLLSFPLMQYLIIHVLPWPKGKAKAPPETFTTKPVNLEHDRAELLRLMERFAATPPDKLAQVHAGFGRLSARDWGVLMYRHLNHHLTQFGV